VGVVGPADKGYGLSLSGGGVRATVFHLGLLLRLAIEDRLERVTTISSVSGGSLAAGLVFSQAGLSWPSSREFIQSVLPAIHRTLTQSSLQGEAFWMTLLRPWMFGKSRGNLFAQAIENAWNIHGTMKQLPQSPRWLINSTCFDTGRNWRFSQTHIGDWKFGHNFDQDVRVSLAMAASAAIPYLAGFVRLAIDPNGWFQIDPATDKPTNMVPPKAAAVRLWDGGVYENLGVEGIFKPQRGLVSDEMGFIIVSDASAHFGEDYSAATGIFSSRFPYLRPPRLFDVATEQVRSLRSRMLIEAIRDGRLMGALVRLGRTVSYIGRGTGKSPDPDFALDEATVDRLARYPTNATAMPEDIFRQLVRHGFETADATLSGYCSNEFPRSVPWNETFIANLCRDRREGSLW
jgi:NTE family protein